MRDKELTILIMEALRVHPDCKQQERYRALLQVMYRTIYQQINDCRPNPRYKFWKESPRRQKNMVEYFVDKLRDNALYHEIISIAYRLFDGLYLDVPFV